MRRRGVRLAVAVAVLAVGGSGCAQPVDGTGQYSTNRSVIQDANVEIRGLPDGNKTDVDVTAGNAIADIQQFWNAEVPRVFNGKAYQPPRGGFYSVDPRDFHDVPCVDTGSDIRGNAFYCPTKDVVAWDRVNLLPHLKSQFGPFLVAMVLAHEWGHVIQTKTGDDPSRTIVRETQADCYAGSWTRWALSGQAPHFQIDRRELDNALAGYLQFRDPVGAGAAEEDAHGNGFDRINAFQEGFEQGVAHCAKFDGSRKFTEVPFTSYADASRNGNLPLDGPGGAVALGLRDLNGTWPALFARQLGGRFSRPRWQEYQTGQGPDCGGTVVDKGVSYCARDNTIFFDREALREVSQHTGGSDYAPMTLIGIAYAEAVEAQAGRSIDGQNGLRRAICLDGVYTEMVTQRDSGAALVLSPGDLDEAVQALLFYAGLDNFFGARGLFGFDRVQAYRQGFNNPRSCAS
jgi:predicted metalloprotease